MEITKSELLNVLLNETGTPFVHIIMETPVRMNKTGNPYFERVIKRTTGNFYLGGEYRKRVNNNRVKEGLPPDFVPELPKGKEHINNCVLIDTKTHSTHYIQLEWFEETPPHKVEYSFNGDPIEKQLFESYMVSKYKPVSQGLERTVNIITPKLSNVRVLHINGQKYEILPETVEQTVED